MSSSLSVVLSPCQLIMIGLSSLIPHIVSFPLLAWVKKGGIVRAVSVSPWYPLAPYMSLAWRSACHVKDLHFGDISRDSWITISHSILVFIHSWFPNTLDRRCHLAPSIWIWPFVLTRVVTPWNVSAFKSPIEEFMAPGAMHFRTAPIFGGFRIIWSKFSSRRGVSGSFMGFLAMCDTENRSVFDFLVLRGSSVSVIRMGGDFQ